MGLICMIKDQYARGWVQRSSVSIHSYLHTRRAMYIQRDENNAMTDAEMVISANLNSTLLFNFLMGAFVCKIIEIYIPLTN